MIETPTTTSTLAANLITCGDPRKTWNWPKREPDYVRRFDLDRSHVPALLDIARQWLKPLEWTEDDENDLTWSAPIHAWRALAQLGAVEVIDLMLEMIGPMEARDDDWYLEEFPDAFAMIGPPAYDKAVVFLDDSSHALYPRVGIAHAIVKIAERHPDLRDLAVMNLSGRLADFENNDAQLNAFLICYLLDLRAREAADVIERAFAADEVDIQIVGNWNHVRRELGVEGRGLVPPKLAEAKPEPFFPWAGGGAILGVGGGATASSDPRKKTYKSKARAKQKVKSKARQRQRKRGRKR